MAPSMFGGNYRVTLCQRNAYIVSVRNLYYETPSHVWPRYPRAQQIRFQLGAHEQGVNLSRF